MTLDDRARRAARDLQSQHFGTPPPIGAVARRRARRRQTAATVASALLLAAAAAWSSAGGGDRRVVADRPSTTTFVVAPTPTSTTPAASRPTRFVAVREDGTLVVVEGGRTQRLADHGDPRSEPAEGGVSFVSALALDTRRGHVYYEVCCEPAAGNVFRLDVRGGAEGRVAHGYHPSVSPDGRFLAFSTYDGLAVVDLASGSRHDVAGGEDYVAGGTRVAWSPDASMLAVERTTWQTPSTILVLPPDARSLSEGRVLRSPDGRGWTLPAFRSDGRLVVAEQCCWPQPAGPARGVVVDPATGAEVTSFPYEGAVLDQAYDDSGTWLLYVTSDRALRWRGGGGEGLVGRGFRSSDW